MHSSKYGCGNAVGILRTSTAQVRFLFTKCTEPGKYLTSQVLLSLGFFKAYTAIFKTLPHPFKYRSPLLFSFLYTLSTVPTITTNIYKGVSS